MRVILCILFLLCPSSGWGLIVGYSGPPASGGSTYDATYDFEGTDAFGSGTLVNWTINTGTPDPNYSSSGLDMQGSDVTETLAADEVDLFFVDDTDATKYISLKFRLNEAIESNENGLISVRNSSNVIIGTFGLGSDLSFRHQANGGTLKIGSAGAYTVGTSVFIRLMVTAGTGANATTQMWYSADGTSWTEVSTVSNNGTTTGNPDRLRLLNATDGEIIYYDYVIENPTIINDASY